MKNGLLQAVGENLQFVLVCAVVIAAIILVAYVLEEKVLRDNIAVVGKVKYLTVCGMLGALAMLLHIFDFPLVFLAPEFYKLDLGEIPAMIGGFALGPVAGVVIACEGADSNTVKEAVTEAAQVLFGIPVNRIKVLKMEVHQ